MFFPQVRYPESRLDSTGRFRNREITNRGKKRDDRMLERSAKVRAQGGVRQNGVTETSSHYQDERVGEQVQDNRETPSEVY